jgi:hypothetical protein
MQAVKLGWLVYIGMTTRELEEEAFRWLTQRGLWDKNGKASTNTNRPVLVKQLEGDSLKPITRKQAKEILHAHAVIVAEDPLPENCTRLECCIQVSAVWREGGMAQVHHVNDQRLCGQCDARLCDGLTLLSCCIRKNWISWASRTGVGG